MAASGLASAPAPLPPSVSPLAGPQGAWSTRLVQVQLKSAFGPIVQVVGDSLQSRGAQSLDELAKHTQLDYPTLKKALLTLVQQDLVQPAYERPSQRQEAAAAAAIAAGKKPRPPRVLYSLQVEHIRHRSRYAHYLLWIKQCFGPECEYILQTLLVHGKLSSRQIMQLTFKSISERNRMAAHEAHRVQVQNAVAAAAASGGTAVKPPPPPPPPAPSAFDRRRIHDVFRQLIASRYIRRAQGLAPPEDAAATAAAAAAASNTESSGGLNTDILQTFLANSAAAQQREQREREEAEAIKAAGAAQAALKASTAAAVAADKPAAAGRKRKKIKDDDEDEEGGGEEAAAAAKPAKKAKKKTKKELEAEAKEAAAAAATAAQQEEERAVQASLDRAGQAADNATASGAGADEDDPSLHSDDHILWSVSHDQFLWEFRKKAVIDYVAAHHSAACSFVVAQLLLQYPSDCCNPAGGERPPVLDVDTIVDLCERAADAQQVRNPVPTIEAAEECMHQMLGDTSNFLERKSSPPGYIINFDSLFSELRMSHIQSLCRARYGSLAARLFRCLLQSQRLEETQLAELCTAPRKDVRRLLYTMHGAQLLSLQEVARSSERMPQKTFYLWGVPRAAVCARYLETLAFGWCNLKLRSEHEAAKAKPVLDKVDTSKRISAEEKAQVEQWKKAADRMEMGMHQINQLSMLFQHF